MKEKSKAEHEASEEFDDLDLQILRLLCEDARISYREIAEKLKVASSTVYLRMKKLRETGVLRGFAPLIDMDKLGWSINVIIAIKVQGGHLVEVENKIAKQPNVYGVYDVTGDWDAMVIAKFKSREELNKFVKGLLEIPNVQHTCTFFVLNIVKENTYSTIV